MAPAPAVDVEGEEGGGGKQQNQGVVKSEGDGGVLAPCAGGSSGREVLPVDAQGKGDAVVVKPEPVCAREGGDGGAGASTSYDLAPASPEPLSDDDQDGDSTECSSSFGDSCCETGDEADGGHPEVNSPFPGNENDGGDQPSTMPRKKKVTDNWRSAVRPMLWRFQWLELRMKDLLSQVSKYDRELALIQQEKELHEELSKKNGSRSEPVQLCRIHENSSMERRKRRRHEETVDTSLYVKKHQILSYFYDKQNKGADTDGLIIDDDSSGPVGDDIKSGYDNVGLLEPKEYDIVTEQLTLQKILLSIDGIQSQVRQLQDHLSKACSKQENRVSFLDNAHVEVTEKRLRTQKRSFSYKNDGYTKPQKKKNLNILLKEGNRSSPAVLPTLSMRATDCLVEVAKGNGEQKSEERGQSHKKALTVDLLLGVDGSLANGHFGDLCKENTDDILIDNQAAKEGYQPFENVKHPTDKPPKLTEKVAAATTSKAENNPASVEVVNTSASVKVEEISAPHEDLKTSGPVVKREPVIDKLPAVKHVYSVRKRDRKAKKDGRGSVAASNNLSKETIETPAAKQEIETILHTAKKLKIGKITPLATEERAENSSSKKQATMNTSSHAKRQKIRNACSSANKQEAEDSSSAARKEITENKKEAEDSSAGAKKEIAENAPSKLRIEKAVLVAVNSRRSQRPRKPKIY